MDSIVSNGEFRIGGVGSFGLRGWRINSAGSIIEVLKGPIMRKRHRYTLLFLAVVAVGGIASYGGVLLSNRSPTCRSAEYWDTWSVQERVDFVAWKLGLREAPPYEALIDLITDTIETRSSGGWPEAY